MSVSVIPFLVCSCLIGAGASVTWLVARRLSAERLVSRILLSSFALRVALAVNLYIISAWHLPILPSLHMEDGFWRITRDAQAYHWLAIAIAESMRWGTEYPLFRYFGDPDFPILVAVVYRFIGAHPLYIPLLNALCWTGVLTLVYRLAERLNGQRGAIAATAVVAFWPSSFIWAAQLMKDSLILLLVLGLLTQFVVTFERGWGSRRTVVGWLAFLPLAFLMTRMRFYLVPLGLAAAAVVVVGRVIWPERKSDAAEPVDSRADPAKRLFDLAREYHLYKDAGLAERTYRSVVELYPSSWYAMRAAYYLSAMTLTAPYARRERRRAEFVLSAIVIAAMLTGMFVVARGIDPIGLLTSSNVQQNHFNKGQYFEARGEADRAIWEYLRTSGRIPRKSPPEFPLEAKTFHLPGKIPPEVMAELNAARRLAQESLGDENWKLANEAWDRFTMTQAKQLAMAPIPEVPPPAGETPQGLVFGQGLRQLGNTLTLRNMATMQEGFAPHSDQPWTNATGDPEWIRIIPAPRITLPEPEPLPMFAGDLLPNIPVSALDRRVVAAYDTAVQIPPAIANALWAPFPWQWLAAEGDTGAFRQVAAVEAILLMLCTPAFALGLFRGLRSGKDVAWLLATFAAVAMTLMGLIVVNIGILFRLRLLFLVPLLVLAGAFVADRWVPVGREAEDHPGMPQSVVS
jgi:hypothetical protein